MPVAEPPVTPTPALMPPHPGLNVQQPAKPEAPTPVAVPAPETPAPKPVAPHPAGRKPVRIYSDYTREVWHVFRPNKLIRLMVIGLVLLIIVGGIAVWLIGGAPTDFQNIPFLQSLLHAE